MKPVIYKRSFVFPLLIALAMFILIVGYLFGTTNLPTYPRIEWQMAQTGEPNISLAWGVTSVMHVTFFAAFALLYLCQEFYGFSLAMGATFACAISLATWLAIPPAFQLASPYLINPDSSRLMIESIGTLNSNLLANSLIFFSGTSMGLMLNALLTKLTRHYLMLIRWIPAACVAGLTYSIFALLVHSDAVYAPKSLLKLALPEASPFLGYAFLSLIPLYILRFLLSLFRGGTALPSFESQGPVFATQPAPSNFTNSAQSSASAQWQNQSAPQADHDDVTAKSPITPQ